MQTNSTELSAKVRAILEQLFNETNGNKLFKYDLSRFQDRNKLLGVFEAKLNEQAEVIALISDKIY